MGRKYLALAGALCIVAVTAGGCKSSEEETVKNIKIGVTLYDQYDTFLSEMMTEFYGICGMIRKKKASDDQIWRFWMLLKAS